MIRQCKPFTIVTGELACTQTICNSTAVHSGGITWPQEYYFVIKGNDDQIPRLNGSEQFFLYILYPMTYNPKEMEYSKKWAYCTGIQLSFTKIVHPLLDSLVVECWLRVREVPGSIPSQGPRHTKDVIKKMVPVVPLFSTEH